MRNIDLYEESHTLVSWSFLITIKFEAIKDFKKFQQKIKLLPVGTELRVIGLEVWCFIVLISHFL